MRVTLALLALLAGCVDPSSRRAPLPPDAVPEKAISQWVNRVGPDEFGVVCYTHQNRIACVKVSQ